MKEFLRGLFVIILIFAMIVGVIIGYAFYEKKDAEQKYNNGICPICETEFHLINVEHYRNGGNHYFYACENEHVIDCPCRPSKNN